MKAPAQMQVGKSGNGPQNVRKSGTEQSAQENENQSAFRKLFEEEEPAMAETSPQFKKI
jgi:hypothetical protein